MSPEVNRTTAYQQIAAHFETRILSGELADGDALPSLASIRSDWKVSADTARRAIDQLKGQGLVLVRQGSPTLAKMPKTVPGPAVAAEALNARDGQPMRLAVVNERSVLLTLID